jgi:hypothetical protein
MVQVKKRKILGDPNLATVLKISRKAKRVKANS